MSEPVTMLAPKNMLFQAMPEITAELIFPVTLTVPRATSIGYWFCP